MKNLNEQLFKAIRSNEIEEVKRLIEEGADVNAVDEYGRIALHKVSFRSSSEIVKMLIDAGADVNVIDEWWNTALDLACDNDHSEIIKMLEEAGAK